MKEMFYSIGRVLTAPFYHIHKGLSLLVQSAFIDIIVSIGLGFLAIGLFVVNQESIHGEVLWNIFYILFLAVIYLIIMGIFHMVKNILFSLLFAILTPLAKCHIFCYDHSYGHGKEESPPNTGQMGKQRYTNQGCEDFSSSFTHSQEGPDGPEIRQGCGML